MIRRALLLLLVGAVVAAAAGYRSFQESYNSLTPQKPTMSIVATGDTAKELAFTMTSRMDSFPCTLQISSGPGERDTVTATWTTPLQAMIYTPDTATYGMDSIDRYDSISFAAHVLGFEWTSPTYQVAVTPGSAYDSAVYLCSVFMAANTFEASWTAPPTKFNVALGLDTTIDYACSLVFAGDTLTFLMDVNARFAGVDSLLDSIHEWYKDSIVAVMGDSVSATLNATNDTIVVVDKATMLARGGTRPGFFASDSMRHDTTFVTVAMICDSMVYAVDNKATLKDSIDAVDGTTKYTLVPEYSSVIIPNRFTTATDSTQNGGVVAQACSASTIVDSLVYLFNNTTNLKDSINAHDSGTYVKIVSRFGTEALTARWTAIMNDSFSDTSSALTTVQFVTRWADSMVAKLNADSAFAAYVTASDSTDSIYLISDDPGLNFVTVIMDTATDSASAQANVTSYSTTTDTIYLSNAIGPGFSPRIMYGDIILRASPTATQGIGLADSGWLWLWSGYNGLWVQVDSAVRNALPCTMHVSLGLGTDTSGNGQPIGLDTLLRPELMLIMKVTDSASDTTATIYYDIITNYYLRE